MCAPFLSGSVSLQVLSPVSLSKVSKASFWIGSGSEKTREEGEGVTAEGGTCLQRQRGHLDQARGQPSSSTGREFSVDMDSSHMRYCRDDGNWGNVQVNRRRLGEGGLGVSVAPVAVPGSQGFKRRSIVRPSLNPKPGGEAGKAGEATPRSSRGRRMREAAMEELGRTVARPRIR